MISPFRLDLPEGSIECEIDLAAGSERLVVLAFKMLPVSSEVAAMARRAAEKLGFEVACKERCGACCRQLVPLSPPEAAMVFEFVETMPEPQKSEVRKGFDLALGRLTERRFLDKLKHLQDPFINDEEHEAITNEYFHQQVPCPFLVNESCSIYEVRPSMCREYLVSSPAENCKSPSDRRISRVPVCVRLSEALARTWASMWNERVQVVPLVFALEWTKEHERIRLMRADSVRMLTAVLGHISDIAVEREKNIAGRFILGGKKRE